MIVVRTIMVEDLAKGGTLPASGRTGTTFIAPPDRRCSHVMDDGAQCRKYIARPGTAKCIAHSPKGERGPIVSSQLMLETLRGWPLSTSLQLAAILQVSERTVNRVVARLTHTGKVERVRPLDAAQLGKPAWRYRVKA